MVKWLIKGLTDSSRLQHFSGVHESLGGIIQWEQVLFRAECPCRALPTHGGSRRLRLKAPLDLYRGLHPTRLCNCGKAEEDTRFGIFVYLVEYQKGGGCEGSSSLIAAHAGWDGMASLMGAASTYRVRVDCAEGEVLGGDAALGEAVVQGGLPDVGHTHNTNLCCADESGNPPPRAKRESS